VKNKMKETKFCTGNFKKCLGPTSTFIRPWPQPLDQLNIHLSVMFDELFSFAEVSDVTLGIGPTSKEPCSYVVSWSSRDQTPNNRFFLKKLEPLITTFSKLNYKLRQIIQPHSKECRKALSTREKKIARFFWKTRV